jgi:hypothetical protein
MGFIDKLNEQIGHEFAASQQYVAIAVHYDAATLPRLAATFYQQSVEERNHAMMLVQYLLDVGEEIRIPGVPAPETSFDDLAAPGRSPRSPRPPGRRATTWASSSRSGSSRSRSRRSRACPRCSPLWSGRATTR